MRMLVKSNDFDVDNRVSININGSIMVLKKKKQLNDF